MRNTDEEINPVESEDRDRFIQAEKQLDSGDYEVADSENENENENDDDIDIKDRWNYPKKNILRLLAAYYGFIVFGMNDSSLGVLVPHLETYYNVNYLVVSIAFLTPFSGYLVAAMVCDYIHRYLGRWGTCVLGTSLQLVSYIVAVTAPKFYGFVIGLAVGGFGSGCLEASWNGWIGSMKHANQLMGLLHGFYGLGGIICPTIFTAMLAQGHQWNICYAVLIGFSALSVTLSLIGFWGDTPSKYREEVDKGGAGEGGSAVVAVMKNVTVWLASCVLLLYVGGEVAFGGWLTTFMIEVRHGDANSMGYVSTGYWAGLTCGRMILGFVTGGLKKEELINAIYMSLAIALMLLLWLVPNLYASAVFAALFGVAIGPIFPTVIVVATKKLPKRLHVSGVGFASAFGGIGAALFPFVNGILSNEHGPSSLAPLVVALFGTMLILWILLSRVTWSKEKSTDSESASTTRDATLVPTTLGGDVSLAKPTSTSTAI